MSTKNRTPIRKRYGINGVRLVLFIAVCYAVVSLVTHQLQANQLASDIAYLEAKLGEARTTNVELKAELDRLQTDEAYVELIARKELGMVKQGEVQYIFETR